jgi:hypothetical protein
METPDKKNDITKQASPPTPIEIDDPNYLTCKLFLYNNSLFVAQICFGLFAMIFCVVMLGKGEPPAIYLPVLTGILGWFFPSPTNRNVQNDGLREKIIMNYMKQNKDNKIVENTILDDNKILPSSTEKRIGRPPPIPMMNDSNNRLEDINIIRPDHVIDILRMLEQK